MYKYKLIIIFILFLSVDIFAQIIQLPSSDISNSVNKKPDTSKDNNSSGTGNNKYTPGLKISGIALDEEAYLENGDQKCKEESTAEIIDSYMLTDKIFLFKTEKGYGVAGITISAKDIETGVNRNNLPSRSSCTLNIGMNLHGNIDCRGERTVKKEPYEGCAYDIKVYEHSFETEHDAFKMIYKILAGQFLDYKEKCIIQPKKSINERMKIF